jgi:hypothetical protein
MYLRATALAILASCTSSSRTPNAQLNARVGAEVNPYDHTLNVGIGLDEGTDQATGYPKYFEIEPDEHVRVGFRDQTLDLLYRPGTTDFYAYRATFALTDELAAGEQIRVEIDRNDDDDVTVSAPAPPPIALVGPAMWQSDQELTITWTPISSEPMAWTSGENDGPIPIDTGTITFPAGILGGTSVGVTFSRTAHSEPASPFQRSTFSISQASYIQIEETP